MPESCWNADIAMYRAKELGRDNFQFYAAEMNVAAHERLALQEGLRNGARARTSSRCIYQPQVDLRSRPHLRRRSAVRWQHPNWACLAGRVHSDRRGKRPDRADRRLGAARGLPAEQGAGRTRACRRSRVCVNVSARQFREKGWVGAVASALAESRPGAALPRAGVDREPDHAGRAAGDRHMQRAAGDRRAARDRRFRHRLLEPSALKSFPVARLKIDQSLRAQSPARRERQEYRHRCHIAGSEAEHEGHRRRR